MKWGVRKSDRLYDMVDFYQKEAAKDSTQLYKIISSSNAAFEGPINWRSSVKLGPLFLKLF